MNAIFTALSLKPFRSSAYKLNGRQRMTPMTHPRVASIARRTTLDHRKIIDKLERSAMTLVSFTSIWFLFYLIIYITFVDPSEILRRN